MKIIGLLPVKNEEWILETCLQSLQTICDDIVVLDDNSTDLTVLLCEKYGCNIIKSEKEEDYNMSNRRSALLSEGRKLKGTHFIFLDADEAFSCDGLEKLKEKISTLLPGEKISLKWITLWKSTSVYRNDSLFNNLYKDVVFCDDGFSAFNNDFISEPRTPISNKKNLKLDDEYGVILHYQFYDWNRVQIKQAWYRCVEFLRSHRSARRINNTYLFTKNEKNIELLPVPQRWVCDLKIPKSDLKIWQLGDIKDMFKKYGIRKFEPLDIWSVKELKSEFMASTGKEPKPKFFPKGFVALNAFKNKIKNRLY